MKKEKGKRGRPPLYKTPEELQAAVDRYFESCKGVPAFDKDGMPITNRSGLQRYTGGKPPTLSGLALFLGYKNRQTFTRQKNRNEEFRDIVLTAHLRCEEFWERALMDESSYDGASFILLTAFGWSKKKIEDVTQPGIVHIVNRESSKDIEKSSDNNPFTKRFTPTHMMD